VDVYLPKWRYSITGLDPIRTAKASGRDLRISPKATREICNAIRHMTLDEARYFLEEVVDKRKPVPYKRHNKKVPHRRGMSKWFSGRFPVKAASSILKLIDNLEMNALDKGLDIDRLRIIHAASQRARVIKGFMPRAFGRASPSYKRLCHVELVVEEQ
jgi:large subunit ribosomal protein L22